MHELLRLFPWWFFFVVSADSYLFVSGARAEEAVLRGGAKGRVV